MTTAARTAEDRIRLAVAAGIPMRPTHSTKSFIHYTFKLADEEGETTVRMHRSMIDKYLTPAA